MVLQVQESGQNLDGHNQPAQTEWFGQQEFIFPWLGRLRPGVGNFGFF
jgi:hypothetical protein